MLGIDTALRSTGVGVVEAAGSRMTAVEYGCLRNAADAPLSACLLRLHEGLREVIGRARPDAAAVEGVFFCKNARTAVLLGQARGAVIAACAAAAVPVFEYPPRRVKQAVVGYGAADKEQVRRMVTALLGLSEPPRDDAGDALAIAICHLNTRTQCAALAPQPI